MPTTDVHTLDPLPIDVRPTDARRFYALIPQREGDGASDLVPLALARQLADRHGGEAHALICGPEPTPAVTRARELGLDHAWIIPNDGAELQPHQLAECYASALRSPALANSLDQALLIVAARSDNEELAGRLAARLHATPLGRCHDIAFDTAGALVAHRAAYGGRLDTVLSCAAGPAIASIRSAQDVASAEQGVASAADRKQETAPDGKGLQVHTLDGIAPSTAPYDITFQPRAEPHAGLDGARLVVSGGRGIGGEDGFSLLYALADKLGGAVGASLPAVDAGWAPVARQVGQSGRYVSPGIYLAIGISGTPQHLAGIDPHTRIVAVNRDAEAPIFSAAQVGAVGEWQALLPELLAALEEEP